MSEGEDEDPKTNRTGRIKEKDSETAEFKKKDIETAEFKKSKTSKRTPRKRAMPKAKDADEVATAQPDSYGAYNASQLNLGLGDNDDYFGINPQERRAPSSK